MATAYRIALIHRGLDGLAEEVERAVMEATEDIAEISKLLEFSTELSHENIPQVVAYLANEEGSRDEHVLEVIDTALERDVAILPIVNVELEKRIAENLPERIVHLNATSWSGEGVSIATSLLEMLGLVETERKLFISYRQNQTRELADQLHAALVQRRFDVFLDRFSVEPGVDFQRRLEEDLGDKAFVLLLESTGLRESPWVRHEIAYAHARRIEMLALTLPDCTELVPTIDDAFRLRLDGDDVSSKRTLSEDALEKTLGAVELAHARALRRRREQILGSVTEKLRIDGCVCHPADDWCVLATAMGGDSGLFWVTPRRPDAKDFYSLSRQHERVMQEQGFTRLAASVVHESGRLAEDHQALMDWLSRVSGGNLATVATCSV